MITFQQSNSSHQSDDFNSRSTGTPAPGEHHPGSPSIDISADQRPSFARLVLTELRKMADTMSGRTLLGMTVAVGIGIQITMLIMKSLQHADDLPFAGFVAAGMYGAKYVLPAVVILSVTGEWTQRAALGTFTLVPHRGRVIASKLGAAIAVTLMACVVTIGTAALVNAVSGVTSGSPALWGTDTGMLVEQSLPLLFVTTMAFGFALLALNSSAALVGYYLAGFALPQILNSIGMFGRIGEVAAWINPAAYTELTGDPSGAAWAHFAVSATIWVIIPVAVGLRRVLTTEIK